ncbi:hypothetical protein EX30DRAFT_58787 [Ascodesmis nigricans]|uniref:Uncharacterized protein n=1 Tax=Ascodesmis nigricans TaxID=341454 RepID=A0A4S2MUY2_9PEZI|nr:hypothetical protein EX30DRAFT_58787 [Ascodesmis nigricans]
MWSAPTLFYKPGPGLSTECPSLPPPPQKCPFRIYCLETSTTNNLLSPPTPPPPPPPLPPPPESCTVHPYVYIYTFAHSLPAI